MKLLQSSLAVALCVNLSFAFSLGDITKMATDTLKQENQTTTASSTTTSNDVLSSGLKEALNKGVQTAVSALGKQDGYLNNADVKIPLPQSLSSAETLIRKYGGASYADDLIKSMNSAASEAAPQTASLFVDAIKKMSITDANKILQGSNSAATDYFKSNTFEQLKALITPIVKKSIQNNQVASYYEAFNNTYKAYGKDFVDNSSVMGYAKSFGVDKFIPGSDDKSLDEYITSKAIDGLFIMIEKEETAIRKDPVNRTTDLLKQVFK